MNVLVVDDDEDQRDNLKELLQLDGFVVVTAKSGREALERLSAIERCVVLLDLHMPDMDGAELAQAMRADTRFAAIPIVFLSAFPQHAPPGYAALQKPVDYARLVRELRAHFVPTGP